MIIRLFMLACLTLFITMPAMAQGDPPPEMMHGPEVVLGPPEGTPMPETPEEGLDLFFDVLAGSDGVVDKEDFMAWVRSFRMPPPEKMMAPDVGDPPMGRGLPPEEMGGLHEGDPELSGLPHPPECSAELQQQEMEVQEESFPCGDRHGNLIFRTTCNMEGFNMAAITLPENRGAGCFSIEALSGHIDFQIVDVDGNVIWHTSMGKEAFDALELYGGPGTVYHIEAIGGSPDGSITIRFVDVNTS